VWWSHATAKTTCKPVLNFVQYSVHLSTSAGV
jgi:hypothetical protein